MEILKKIKEFFITDIEYVADDEVFIFLTQILNYDVVTVGRRGKNKYAILYNSKPIELEVEENKYATIHTTGALVLEIEIKTIKEARKRVKWIRGVVNGNFKIKNG